jgi:myxalamid-type polyketide synthase MxaB
VLEAAPVPQPHAAACERPLQILALSAKTPTALRALSKKYELAVEQGEETLADICYTANSGRSHFSHRLSVIAESKSDLLAGLRAATADGAVHHGAPKIAMLFTGQGSQSAGMGRELYETQPVFRRSLERCDAILRAWLSPSLLEVLYPTSDDDRELIHQTAYTQPALFSLEFALAELWKSWGIRPQCVMGHSVGEYAAACVAGVFSVEDGLKLIAARGRLMQALPKNGTMIAIKADGASVAPLVARHRDVLSIAVINGPADVAISGERNAAETVAAELEAAGIKTRELTVSHAFHSPLMDAMLEDFAQVAKTVTYAQPRVSLISNLTGAEAGPEVARADYWVRHAREPVLFARGMSALSAGDCDVFLEVGPQPVLLGLGRTCVTEDRAEASAWLPTLRSNRGNWKQIIESLSALYLRGAEIDWAGFDRDYSRRKVELPSYPFERQRYWFSGPSGYQPGRTSLLPLIDSMAKSPLVKETIFTTPFSVKKLPFLADHRVFEEVVVPGACYLSMVLSSAQLEGLQSCRVEDVIFVAPMALPDDHERIVQEVLTPDAEGGGVNHFKVISTPAGDTSEVVTHATGRFSGPVERTGGGVTLAEVQARCRKEVTEEELLDRLRGMSFGPAFQWIDGLWSAKEEALARLRVPEVLNGAEGFWLHPALLDTCFQVAGAAQVDNPPTETMLPFGVKRLEVFESGGGPVWWVHAKEVTAVDEYLWDFRLFDERGRVVADIHGFELRKAPKEGFLRRQFTSWLYRTDWQPQALDAGPSLADPGTWLIFDDGEGLGTELAAQLRGQGQRCVIALEESSLGHLLDDSAYRGIVYLWGARSAPALESVPARTQAVTAAALQLVRKLIAADIRTPIYFVSRGSQSVDGTGPADVTGAPLWGLARTMLLETPDLPCVCVDLPPNADHTANASSLLGELRAPAAEAQVAYRGTGRYVARMVRHTDSKPAVSGPFKLQLAEYGSPDHLRLVPATRTPPRAGQVEIEVKATALNFRDVLNSLGLLKEYYAQALGITQAKDVPLGWDCAGIITAVGPGSNRFKVGDEVIGTSAGSAASYVTFLERDVVHKPACLTFEEASAIPSVFLTAHYGLLQLAGLQKGERILIHAASGGVGQAAVQLAQAVGAEVFATASPGKWDFLRAQGVHHVLNSRTLGFADEILRLTDGQGVDVVLNSLTGAVIDKSLSVLKANGRFVEIGKLGILSPEEMATRRPDARYFTFDLNEVIEKDKALVVSTLNQVTQWMTEGRLRALPQTVFPMEDVVEAYRFMQQTKHVGKVVLRLGNADAPAVRADGSYLITGGMGSLGLQVAKCLVDQGARHLVLSGRSARVDEAVLEELRAGGASVEVIRADVSNSDDVARLVAECGVRAPLRGVVHAAGVLDDGAILNQTDERLARVMGPKVNGAWLLHTHTQALPLDFFVCFSSMASMMGSPGQSNYAAANAFLDALAGYRRAKGLPAISINWGPWADAGMAAKIATSNQGVEKIDSEGGLKVFLNLLERPSRDVPSQIGVFRIQWPVFQRNLPPRMLPFLSQLVRQAPPAKSTGHEELLARFQAATEDEGRALVEAAVHGQLIEVLGLQASHKIASNQPFASLGIDSLMTVELKNRLERVTQVAVPVAKMMPESNIGTVAAFLHDKLRDKAKSATAAAPSQTNAQDPKTELLEMLYERVLQIPQAFVDVEKQEGRQVLIGGRWRTDFASCNYLGFDFHPEVMRAVPEAIAEWGVHPSWTRAVASPKIYVELESALAELVGVPDTMVFPSLSLLHMGVLPVLAGETGVILKDIAAHESVLEGCHRARIEGAEWYDFRHNDLADLEQKLQKIPGGRKKIIATDGVYSMGSDHPPLFEYVRLAKRYDATVYVDDAHGFGILGAKPDAGLPYGYGGNGIVRHFGLELESDRIIYVAGLSKAFSSYAAFITCADERVKWDLRAAGPFVFSGPTSVASLASALAGLRVNRCEGDHLRRDIHRMTGRLLSAAREIGFEVDNASGFPIVGVVMGTFDRMAAACQALWENDILITPAMYPAVPLNRSLARFSITAANTEADIDQAIRGLEAAASSIGMPGRAETIATGRA